MRPGSVRPAPARPNSIRARNISPRSMLGGSPCRVWQPHPVSGRDGEPLTPRRLWASDKSAAPAMKSPGRAQQAATGPRSFPGGDIANIQPDASQAASMKRARPASARAVMQREPPQRPVEPSTPMATSVCPVSPRQRAIAQSASAWQPMEHSPSTPYSHRSAGPRASPTSRHRYDGAMWDERSQQLANSRGSPSEEISTAGQGWLANNTPPTRLLSGASIYEALQPPHQGQLQPVRLLRCSWLLDRAAQIRKLHSDMANGLAEACWATRRISELALPRRQDLPEEAFISNVELQRHQPRGFVGEHRMAVIAISHCWRSEAHADPEGACHGSEPG